MNSPHITAGLLVDYIHRELAPEDDALVYAHLAECPDCRREQQAEVWLTEALRGAARAEEFELPPAIVARVRQSVRSARPAPLERLRAFLRPAGAVAAAAVLAAGAFFVSPLGHPASPPMVDARYYFEAHAAQQADNPFSEHGSGAAAIESSMVEGQDEAGTLADRYGSGFTAPTLLGIVP
ncbi:MAG: anti-sigma factor [Candidatus Baltobacteraceae bacterium]|jgi:anti-sigma factor RsiW